jgi:hypothetical protein
MAIRDRGKKKWHGAFFMPEQVKMQRDFWRDINRISKPIIDEHEAEEFDQRICNAMEYILQVKLTVWSDGFTEDITGRIHYYHSRCLELVFMHFKLQMYYRLTPYNKFHISNSLVYIQHWKQLLHS